MRTAVNKVVAVCRLGSTLLLCAVLCCTSQQSQERAAVVTSPHSERVMKDANTSYDASLSDKVVESIDPDQFVDIQTLAPGIVLDMRYAGQDNFVGETLYPISRCLLRLPAAQALARVQKRLAASSLSLLIWDCYRPFSIQEKMWKVYPKARYVAHPVREKGIPLKGSKHNRGAAVDLSLVTLGGRELAMPTDHDDFSPRAHRDARIGISPKAIANSQRLEQVMHAEGFRGIASEWWHFDFSGWEKFPLSDQPLQ